MSSVITITLNVSRLKDIVWACVGNICIKNLLLYTWLLSVIYLYTRSSSFIYPLFLKAKVVAATSPTFQCFSQHFPKTFKHHFTPQKWAAHQVTFLAWVLLPTNKSLKQIWKPQRCLVMLGQMVVLYHFLGIIYDEENIVTCPNCV